MLHSNTQGLHASWAGKVPIADIVRQVGTPVFIYSADALRYNVTGVKRAANDAGLGHRVRLYVPFFPNSNPHVLQPLRDEGLGLLVQIPAEYEYTSGFGYDDFIVSPGHISDEEIGYWANTGLPMFLGSLGEVNAALEAGSRQVCARIDSLNSGKPGIKRDELIELRKLLDEYGATMSSLEVYCGSGNSQEEMVAAMDTMLSIHLGHFPEATSLNFAGGHGFVYEEWQTEDKHFAWEPYFSALAQRVAAHGVSDGVEFWFEPARDLLADVGMLVLGVKRKIVSNAVHNLIPTDGTRMLMPSAQLRDRHHNLVFLDANFKEIQPGPDAMPVSIRGRTILRNDYLLPREYAAPPDLAAGSYLVVLDVGAYCATQHMEFLNVPPAAEVLFDGERRTVQVVTERGADFDKWRNVCPCPRPLDTGLSA